jgi:D-alanine-D-alanine ligase
MRHLLILHGASQGPARTADETETERVACGLAEILSGPDRFCEVAHADLDLGRLRNRLVTSPPDLIFNLVESLCGQDRLACAVPALLESLSLPFTGNPTAVIALADDKLALKRQLRALGLPTPSAGPGEGNGDFLVKARFQHASLGLGPGARVASWPEAARLIEAQGRNHGTPFFAEAFIPGREFNLSLLETASKDVRILPPAEIEFRNWPANRPRIVDYEAKWDPGSPSSQGTVRVFPRRDGADRRILETLSVLAGTLFDRLGLTGYARIDFRVDEQEQPWIIDLNPNPTLDPEAGFVQAALAGGIGYRELLEEILNRATTRVASQMSYRGPHEEH